MALIDVVKWDGSFDEFVWKFPSENLRCGTQLVVKPGQNAVFVKGGKILDVFESGTCTLTSGNLPLLTKLIGLPFGGNTPFQAEVWFVNTVTKLDNKFGTSKPMQLEDPKYGLIFAVRAFGQYGVRIMDAGKFVQTLSGAAAGFSAEKIHAYFRARLVSSVASHIGAAVVKARVSVVQLPAQLDEFSEKIRPALADDFAAYGLELTAFHFESVNIPESDPSYIKLKAIKEKAAELNIVGRDIYQLDKSMDVLKTAARNEGMSGTVMSSGMGMGMGVMMGGQLGQQAGQVMSSLPLAGASAPPPVPLVSAVAFYLVLNGRQEGPFAPSVLGQMVRGGMITTTTPVWRQGMAGWQAAENVAEFAALFAPAAPPALPPGTPPPVPPMTHQA